MAHELPELPYAKDALAPYISEETVEWHYATHHQGYVTKLNKAVAGTEFDGKSLEETMKKASGGVFNNAAQVWNHTFYWNSLTPGGSQPDSTVGDALQSAFGGLESFKQKFTDAAATLFGSGWTWLVKNKNGELEIQQSSNADNPLVHGHKPLLTLDVWEHAYYIDYRAKRPAYIDAFWSLTNWEFVGKNLGA